MSHPQGRQAVAVNQPPSGGTNYPFLSPSDDVRLLFGDFYLSYRDTDRIHTLPFRIGWLFGFGDNAVSPPGGWPTPTHDRDLVILDGDDEVVFDSTLADHYTETAWAGRLLILEWRTDTETCRCTIHTEWHPDQTPLTYDDYIEPEDARLDGRTYERQTDRLLGIKVGDTVYTGQIRIESGYNMQVVAEELVRRDGGRHLDRINLDSIPGAGLGRRPACTDETVLLRTINRVAADSAGNFTLELDDCLRSQPPMYVSESESDRVAYFGAEDLSDEEAAAALVLYNDCGPCGDCDDFINVYKGLKSVWDAWGTVGTEAEAVRDTYADSRERFIEARECVVASPARLVTRAEPGFVVAAAQGFCNMTGAGQGTGCCLSPVEMRFTFQLYSGVTEIAWPAAAAAVDVFIKGPSTDGEEPYTPIINGQTFRVIFDFLDPQQTVSARLRVSLPGGSDWNVKLTATIHAADSPGEDCELPTATPPAEVQAIWSAAGIGSPATTRSSVTRSLPLLPWS